MKNLFLFLFLAMVTTRTHAQTEIAYDSLTDIHQYSFRAQQYDYSSNNQQNSYHTVAIKGTCFLFNGWQKGIVPLQNNRNLAVPLNYNVMEDHLVILVDGEQREVYPELFVIKDMTFIRINNQYYEALHQGKTKLLRRYRARLDKVERNGYNDNIKYDYEYSKTEELYLQQEDGTLTPVRLNERSLLSKLNDTKTARSIVKSQNLNLRSEKDVITLLATLEQ
jgi:hypothetical protein